MANRSGGCHQDDTRFFRFDRVGDVFGECFFKAFRVYIVADKRVENFREFPTIFSATYFCNLSIGKIPFKSRSAPAVGYLS
jgi:hypothetical protein